MCDPITAITIGLSIAQGAVGYAGQQAQYKQQMEVFRQNAINASTATENQYKNLNIRAMQEDAAANQQQQQTNIEVAQAAATTQVAASEGGVAGLSVSHVLRDLYSQQGRNDAALASNHQMSRAFLAGEKKAAEAGGQNQINSVPIPEKPSILPTVLNIFGSALGAYNNRPKKG